MSQPIPPTGQKSSKKPEVKPSAIAPLAPPTGETSPQASAPRREVRLGPDHRDLYVLIIGLLVGILLCPAVLGRVSPATYDWLFIGSGPGLAKVTAFDSDSKKELDNLKASGASEQAYPEKQRQVERDRLLLMAPVIQAQQDHQHRFTGRMAALILAIVAVMVFEAMIDPTSTTGPGRMRGRFATARYALTAIWLAMLLANPTPLLEGASVLFVVMLVALALGLAWMPLGWAGKRSA